MFLTVELTTDSNKRGCMSRLNKEEVFKKHYINTYQAALFITRDKLLAEDATQEAFVKALRNIDNLRDPEKIGPWLAVIAMNTAKDLHKQTARYLPSGQIENWLPDSNTAKKLDVLEWRIALEKILSNLPPKFREVLVLRFYYDLPLEEIATQLNIKIGTVKSRLHRAIMAISRVLAVEIPENKDPLAEKGGRS